MKKFFPYFMSFLALALAAHIFIKWQYLGFPDGHLTEYDQTMNKLYPLYAGIQSVFAGAFVYIGRNLGRASLKITFMPALIIWLIFTGICFFMDHYFYVNLEHGQGG